MIATNAVLLAGGRLNAAFAREAGADVKALIRVGGITLLERAACAVREAGVDTIVVVGPEAIRCSLAGGAFVAEGTGGIDNLFRGLEWLQHNAPSGRILIGATDLPFITADAVQWLLRSAQPGAALTVPILRREEFLARFPEAPATYVRLSDGQWTSASLFVADPGILSSMRPRLEQVFAHRKSPLRTARMLGPICAAKFLTRRLCVEDIERRVCHLLGINGTALRGCPPELAYDVDLPEELAYARQLLERTPLNAAPQEDSPNAAR